jgi:hypothetical protein
MTVHDALGAILPQGFNNDDDESDYDIDSNEELDIPMVKLEPIISPPNN